MQKNLQRKKGLCSCLVLKSQKDLNQANQFHGFHIKLIKAFTQVDVLPVPALFSADRKDSVWCSSGDCLKYFSFSGLETYIHSQL